MCWATFTSSPSWAERRSQSPPPARPRSTASASTGVRTDLSDSFSLQHFFVRAEDRLQQLDDLEDDVHAHQSVADARQPRGDAVETAPPLFLVIAGQPIEHVVEFAALFARRPELEPLVGKHGR